SWGSARDQPRCVLRIGGSRASCRRTPSPALALARAATCVEPGRPGLWDDVNLPRRRERATPRPACWTKGNSSSGWPRRNRTTAARPPELDCVTQQENEHLPLLATREER